MMSENSIQLIYSVELLYIAHQLLRLNTSFVHIVYTI